MRFEAEKGNFGNFKAQDSDLNQHAGEISFSVQLMADKLLRSACNTSVI
jgi:hypothetical protein